MNGQGDDPNGVMVSITDGDSAGWKIMLTGVTGDYSDEIYVYTTSGSVLMTFDPNGNIPDTSNVLSNTGSKNIIVSSGQNAYCDRNFTLTLYDGSGTKISSCVFYQPTGAVPRFNGNSVEISGSTTTATVNIYDSCNMG